MKTHCLKNIRTSWEDIKAEAALIDEWLQRAQNETVMNGQIPDVARRALNRAVFRGELVRLPGIGYGPCPSS